MNVKNVNRKLIFLSNTILSNTIPNIETNVEDIIHLDKSGKLFIGKEYFDSINFLKDNNINDNNSNININFDINNTENDDIIN